MDIRNIADQAPFVTKDGSGIRELLAHRNSCIRRQTLAEARLPPCAGTTRHHHVETEEIDYVLEGHGRMSRRRRVGDGPAGRRDRHPPGASHQLTTWRRRAQVPLLLSPGYEHVDTILEAESGAGSEARQTLRGTA